MQHFTFKTVDEYREWRAHWRKEYRSVSARLKYAKDALRRRLNNVEAIKAAQRGIAHDRQVARSLLMGRQAVEFAHKINRAASNTAQAEMQKAA